MCVVVTYDVDSWIKRGASRPAFAGSISPECEILRMLQYEIPYAQSSRDLTIRSLANSYVVVYVYICMCERVDE